MGWRKGRKIGKEGEKGRGKEGREKGRKKEKKKTDCQMTQGRVGVTTFGFLLVLTSQ